MYLEIKKIPEECNGTSIHCFRRDCRNLQQMWENDSCGKALHIRNVCKQQQKLKAVHFQLMLKNVWNTGLLYYVWANHFLDFLLIRMPNVKTTSVCPSGCWWPTISHWIICQIFIKFNVQVLLIKFVKQACASYKSAQREVTLLKGMNGMLPIYSTIFIQFG